MSKITKTVNTTPYNWPVWRCVSCSRRAPVVCRRRSRSSASRPGLGTTSVAAPALAPDAAPRRWLRCRRRSADSRRSPAVPKTGSGPRAGRAPSPVVRGCRDPARAGTASCACVDCAPCRSHVSTRQCALARETPTSWRHQFTKHWFVTLFTRISCNITLTYCCSSTARSCCECCIHWVTLTLWRPLLPHSYKASCARPH